MIGGERMKFSRNPDSGILEAYTDEGMYIGIISTMGDSVKQEVNGEDGGPGSGNWGHQGRPGMRGGSGKGSGGKEFRAGSKEEGFRRNEETRLARSEGRLQIKGPERSEKKKTGKKIETTFSSKSSRWGDAPSKEFSKRYKEAQEMAKETFESGENDLDKMEDVVGRLASAAQQSDAWKEGKSATQSVDRFGIEGVPAEWPERLDEDELAVLEGMSQKTSEMSAREYVKWMEENKDDAKLMFSLQSKLLGAEVEPEITKEALKEYAGKEEREEVPGQLSMFTGENVPMKEEGKPWQKDAMDGGPGSGNFGHKGRPGLRGGSGPGGGAQYRGGRSDIGYHGSRKDWLNGLSGESQAKATKMLSGFKQRLDMKKKARDRIQDLWKKGMITETEMNNALKVGDLHKVRDDMTPEEFCMTFGSVNERKNLTDAMAESRKWDQYAGRLLAENLSDEEKTVLKHLGEKAKNGPLNDVEMQCYYDMKSKACGGPVSGNGIHEEILYESGAMERPKPPADQPDYEWYDSAKSAGYLGSNMIPFMQTACKDQPNYRNANTSKEDFEKINQRFLDTLEYGNMSPNEISYYGIRAMQGMRSNIALAQNTGIANFVSRDFQYSKDHFDRLSDQEKTRLLECYNAYANHPATDISELNEQKFQDTELEMRKTTPRRNEDKKLMKDYIKLQEKMLINAKPSEQNPFEAEKSKAATEFEKNKAEQQKNFQSSDAAKAKAEAQRKIAEFNPRESVDEDGNLTSGSIAKGLSETGIFMNGRKMTSISDNWQDMDDAAGVYVKVAKEYPFLVGDFGTFGDNEHRSDVNGSCHMDPDTDEGEININMDFFKDRKRANANRRSSEIMGLKVKTDEGTPGIKATTSHEIGHTLANWLHRVVYGGEYDSKKEKHGYTTEVRYFSRAATEIERRTLRALKLKKSDIEPEVSRYATTNSNEFFAECFCEIQCSSNPRRVAVEFKKQLDNFIKENNITANMSANLPYTKAVFKD